MDQGPGTGDVAASSFDNIARTPRRRNLRWTIFSIMSLPMHHGQGQREEDEQAVEWAPTAIKRIAVVLFLFCYGCRFCCAHGDNNGDYDDGDDDDAIVNVFGLGNACFSG